METRALWNAARMWETSDAYDQDRPEWRMSFRDFRRLMITASAVQWNHGRGPFCHIPRNNPAEFLRVLAWNANTSPAMIRNHYLLMPLGNAIRLDPRLPPSRNDIRNTGQERSIAQGVSENEVNNSGTSAPNPNHGTNIPDSRSAHNNPILTPRASVGHENDGSLVRQDRVQNDAQTDNTVSGPRPGGSGMLPVVNSDELLNINPFDEEAVVVVGSGSESDSE